MSAAEALDFNDSSPTELSRVDLSSAGTSPVSPSILKRSSLSQKEQEEIGWVAPDNWEFDHETLAAKVARLKKKQDGEVENPAPVSPPAVPNLEAVLAAESSMVRAKRSMPSAAPVSGTRRSERGKGEVAVPIMLKASRRAASKDPGNSSSLPAGFVVLDSIPDSHLLSVAKDICVDFSLASGSSPSSLLSLVRAKEIAQAKLAEAMLRKKQEVGAADSSVEPTATLTLLAPQASVAPSGEQAQSVNIDPDVNTPLTDLIACKKKKTASLPGGPRPNLRSTPARQARVSASGAQ